MVVSSARLQYYDGTSWMPVLWISLTCCWSSRIHFLFVVRLAPPVSPGNSLGQHPPLSLSGSSPKRLAELNLKALEDQLKAQLIPYKSSLLLLP